MKARLKTCAIGSSSREQKPGLPVAVRANEEVFFHTQRNLWDWHAVRAIFVLPDGAGAAGARQNEIPADRG
jgi:hypothetical protein